MPEGNASVEVACVKAEIDIDLEKFEEALEQAQELFEQFADSISEGLSLKINVEDDGLIDAENRINSLKDSLSNISGGNIEENIDSDGTEEVLNNLEEVKELQDEISEDETIVDITSDGTDEVLEALRSIQSKQDEITDMITNVTLEAHGIDEVKAELDEVKDSEREAGEEGEGLTETLGTAIYALQAVYSAMSTVAKGSLEGFAQMQISGNIANRVFGKFGENVKSFSENSVNALGLASGETLHYADTLGLALKSQGASNQQAATMAMNLIKVADNLSLASGGSVTMQQAVQILTSAIAGQTYGLKSLGINVTGVNKKWTPLHQAMYIMTKVSKDVTRNFGALGQNMNTTAGQIARTKAIVGEFGESIGQVLAPQLSGLNRKLSSLYKWWNNLSESTKHLIVVFGEVVVGVLGVASALYVGIKAVEAMQTVFEVLSGLMDTNPIGLALMAIAGACLLLYEAWKHNFGGMRNIVDHFISDLRPAFGIVKSIFESLKPEIENLWHNVVILGKSLVQLLKPLLKIASPFIATGIVMIALQFKGIITVVDIVSKALVGLIKVFFVLGQAITHPIETAKDIVTGNFDAIYNSAKANFDKVMDVTTNSSNKMKNTYVENLQQMINDNKAKMRTMEQIAQDGGKSVNRVQLENLRKANANLEEKIKQAESTVKQGTGNMAQATSINGKKMVQAMNISGKDMSTAYISHLKTMLNQTKEQISQVHSELAKGNDQISSESARSLERTQRNLERNLHYTQSEISRDSKVIAQDVKDGTSKAKIAAIENSMQMKEKYVAQLESMLNQTNAKLQAIKSSVSNNSTAAKRATLQNLEETQSKLESELNQAESNVSNKTSEMKNTTTQNANEANSNTSQVLGMMQSTLSSHLGNMLSNTQSWGQNTKNTVNNTFSNANSTTSNKMSDMANTTENKMLTILNSITTKLTSMLNAINRWGNNSTHAFSTTYENVNVVVNRGMGNMVSTSQGHLDNLSSMFNSFSLNSAGQNIVGSLLSGLQGAWSSVTSWASSAASSLSSFFSHPLSSIENALDGSHETGLSYVPWDGYRAELHKGEMVLTREQAESYRSGNNGGVGGNTNITVNTSSSDPYEIASSVRRTLNQLANGF